MMFSSHRRRHAVRFVAIVMAATSCDHDQPLTGLSTDTASAAFNGERAVPENSAARLTTTARGYTPPTTFFISSVSSMRSRESRAIESFTVPQTRTFVFRFLPDFLSVAAIIPSSQLSTFLSGGGASAYYAFNNQFSGGESVTLGPGSYAVVIRNNTTSDNRYDLELDLSTTMPPDIGATFQFAGYPLQRNATLAVRGRATHAFTIRAGYRYWIDGGNSGFGTLTTCIAPASQAQAFAAGQQISCVGRTVDQSGGGPGGMEITAAPGPYILIARNDGTTSVNYGMVLEEWLIRKR